MGPTVQLPLLGKSICRVEPCNALNISVAIFLKRPMYNISWFPFFSKISHVNNSNSNHEHLGTVQNDRRVGWCGSNYVILVQLIIYNWDFFREKDPGCIYEWCEAQMQSVWPWHVDIFFFCYPLPFPEKLNYKVPVSINTHTLTI